MNDILKMKLKLLTGKYYFNDEKSKAKEDLKLKREKIERELNLICETLIELDK